MSSQHDVPSNEIKIKISVKTPDKVNSSKDVCNIDRVVPPNYPTIQLRNPNRTILALPCISNIQLVYVTMNYLTWHQLLNP